jgi:hypothetical protein
MRRIMPVCCALAANGHAAAAPPSSVMNSRRRMPFLARQNDNAPDVVTEVHPGAYTAPPSSPDLSPEVLEAAGVA